MLEGQRWREGSAQADHGLARAGVYWGGQLLTVGADGRLRAAADEPGVEMAGVSTSNLALPDGSADPLTYERGCLEWLPFATADVVLEVGDVAMVASDMRITDAAHSVHGVEAGRVERVESKLAPNGARWTAGAWVRLTGAPATRAQ